MTRLGLLVGLLLLPLWGTARPARANPHDAFGYGPRATALGSAYAAVADDVAAGYYNPAGLARSADLRIDIGYQAALPFVSLNGVTGATEQPQTRGLLAGIVVPGQVLGVRLAFGVTLYMPDQYVTRIRVLRYDQPRLQMYDNRTQRFYMAANLAVRVLPGLYLGGGLSFMSRTLGTATLRGTITLGDPEQSDLSASIDVDLLALRYPQAGVLWEINRRVSVAAVYRHGFLLELDQAFDIHADVGGVGKPPVVQGGMLNERARSVDLFQPWQLVLGTAVKLLDDRLLLSADLTFARHSDMPPPAARFDLTLDIKQFNDYVRLPRSVPYPSPGFHDLLIPAIGAEWRALDGLYRGKLALDLRAGYRYEASPVPLQDGESSFADADKHIFSLGAGIELSRLLPALPKPLSIDVFTALTYLPERVFRKADPRSLVGDFTVTGTVFQAGTGLRWRL